MESSGGGWWGWLLNTVDVLNLTWCPRRAHLNMVKMVNLIQAYFITIKRKEKSKHSS